MEIISLKSIWFGSVDSADFPGRRWGGVIIMPVESFSIGNELFHGGKGRKEKEKGGRVKKETLEKIYRESMQHSRGVKSI